MDNNLPKMLDQPTFNMWMDSFITNKQNQLEYSLRMSPKRMEKITLDLSVAPSQPLEINVPFTSLVVSRVYSTASPTTDKAGTLQVLFDTPDLANIKNAISLFPNDTVRMKNSTRKGFFTWTAQSDTSVDIFLFPDIEVIAGTTKTQIVGTVSVQNTSSTANYNRYPIPALTRTSNQSGGAGDTDYTVPAGRIARATVTLSVRSGGVAQASLSGNRFARIDTASASQVSVSTITLNAGDILRLTTDATAGSFASAFIEEYTI